MSLNFIANSWFERNRSIVFLAVLTVCMVVAIEVRHPYFFIQDDNLHQNLPNYVHNYRSFLAGEIPLFNFHQFLGTPFLSCIQSAAFYPPNYVALFLSKLWLGHYWGAMEFIATFHLILASIGFFRLMRYFGLQEWSCCFGAIAWTFCGFVMTVGNSWIQVVGYAAYLPWILLCSLRQTGKFDPRSFVILMVLRVLALFLGNPPFFIYVVTFDILTVTILYLVSAADGQHGDATRSRPDLRGGTTLLVRQGINYLCAALIAAPLLLPAMHQISISAGRKAPLTWEQYSQNSYKLIYWLNGLFTPFSDIEVSPYLAKWCEQQFISHIGWLTIVFCIASLWVRSEDRKPVTVFLTIALFSFLWANDTFVTRLIYHLPLYNRQRWPLKLCFFTSFYLILAASFGFNACYVLLNRFLRKRKVSILLAVVFLVHIGNFLALYLSTPQRMFARHLKNVDKPPFDEPLKEMLHDGRIATVVQADSRHDHTVPLLGFEYATFFGLYHFAGYELLVSEDNLKASLELNYSADFYVDKDTHFSPAIDDLDYLRKWGVKWYVVDQNVRLQSGGLEKLYDDGKRVILYDKAARPLVYWQDNVSSEGTTHAFSTNSIRVDTVRANSGPLIVNVLHNPFFVVAIDGEKTELLRTTDNQMLVNIPPGRHKVEIAYKDPYFYTGLYVTGIFLVLTAVGIIMCRSGKKWQ